MKTGLTQVLILLRTSVKVGVPGRLKRFQLAWNDSSSLVKGPPLELAKNVSESPQGNLRRQRMKWLNHLYSSFLSGIKARPNVSFVLCCDTWGTKKEMEMLAQSRPSMNAMGSAGTDCTRRAKGQRKGRGNRKQLHVMWIQYLKNKEIKILFFFWNN